MEIELTHIRPMLVHLLKHLCFRLGGKTRYKKEGNEEDSEDEEVMGAQKIGVTMGVGATSAIARMVVTMFEVSFLCNNNGGEGQHDRERGLHVHRYVDDVRLILVHDEEMDTQSCKRLMIAQMHKI